MLQEAVQAKGRASAALQQAQTQQAQTAEHLSLLTQQLTEERQQVAALSAIIDSLQAEHNRYKTQVCHQPVGFTVLRLEILTGDKLTA